MTSTLKDHCKEITRCNQRGGRMLSIIDLVDAGSLPEELAAYLLNAVNRAQASFMVGANPGGAGKTTVMGALLNLVNSSYELQPADSLKTLQHALAKGEKTEPRCWICHEISSGPYYAYLWGEAARAFFALSDYNHMLATNLHADTYDQAYRQICYDNKVPQEHFYRMHLQIYLTMETTRAGGIMRRINRVYESNGHSGHQLIYALDKSYTPHPPTISNLATEQDFQECSQFISHLKEKGIKRIEQVRKTLLAKNNKI